MSATRRWAAAWQTGPAATPRARSPRRPPPPRRRVSAARRTSRLLLAGALFAVAGAVVFAINAASDQPVGAPVLLWAPMIGSTAVLTTIFIRTSRADHLPAPTQRFWRHLSVAALLVGGGTSVQAYDVLRYPHASG